MNSVLMRADEVLHRARMKKLDAAIARRTRPGVPITEADLPALRSLMEASPSEFRGLLPAAFRRLPDGRIAVQRGSSVAMQHR
jgi:hypothetical protein